MFNNGSFYKFSDTDPVSIKDMTFATILNALIEQLFRYLFKRVDHLSTNYFKSSRKRVDRSIQQQWTTAQPTGV